jgi:transcription termination factor Rho
VTSDRSTLEGKDRAELTVIAQAMGNKVGSRMRKAQIIDLIIGDDAKVEAPADESAKQNNDDAADSEFAFEDVASDDEPAESQGSESSEVEDSAGDGDRSDSDEAKRGSGKRNQNARSDNERNDNARNENRGDNERSDNERSDNERSDNERGQNEADGGNKRRRRRRGRDRDELPWEGEPVSVDGFLDLRSDGYGFLRVEGGIPSRDDCYVPVKMVRDFGLRSGDRIRGTSRPAARNEKNPALLTVDAVNERDPEEARGRSDFDDLTPIFPNEQLVLERASTPADLTTRIIDLVAPIGKGQRGLIVAPPKAGKTTVIKEIVRSIETNNPEVQLIVLLIDERPEEVTDMKRWMKKGEVVASTFDRPTEEHITVAELVAERARRMVESGDDVCIVMDGITRLARAYNLSGRFSGRTMSGGVDAGALYPPKRLFGSARNIEDGGSLTVLATALVETGSRMDEVIFEEFKGTGNMELRLSRDAAEKRMWPAVDIAASSTRHDELLMDSKNHGATTKMRRVLDAVGDEGSSKTVASLDLLLDRLTNFRTNTDFLNEVAKSK